jgi:nicotinate phosphoribosyltransferase
MTPPDPFAAKRAAMRDEFFARFFLLGGWLGGTDTYKRTMWAAVPDIALARAGYSLVMRKGLPETGADGQLIMAGHEAMLAQWFHRPLQRGDIELARHWFTERSAVQVFPHVLWDSILAQNPGKDIYLPVDVWGFPGGQSFLPGVPCLFFEGPGGAVSYLEPAMCRYFAPVLWATKGRVMKLATPRDAEFGLRAAPDEALNIVLLLARFVGGGGRLTSNDTAEFLFPELFRTVGTIGHEMMSAGQTLDRPLGEAEYEMMDRFVASMGTAALLCDLVDAESVGLENAIRVMQSHPETNRVGIRVDSGDTARQCVQYFRAMQVAGLGARTIVFENEVTPETVPGAGGYWWRLIHRDTVAACFKRTATAGRPNVKFSNDAGKESLPGYLRVYADGDTLIVADASEPAAGEPLFVKLVEQGRIVYRESFAEQAARADRSWGRCKRVQLSPRVAGWQERYRAMRDREVAAARQRLDAPP